MAQFRLYHYWRSTSSWRVRWALAHKQVACEYVAIDLLTDESDEPAHKARNPMGYVPVLEIVDHPVPGHVTGDTMLRTRWLGESIAIIEWLEETFPASPLLPGDAFQRARIRQLAEIINAGTQPLVNLTAGLRHSADPAEQKRWNQDWIRKGLGAYEALVHGAAGRFSVGDQITLADLALIPQCYSALRNDVPLEDFPTISRIHLRCLELESCRASHPDRFKPNAS